MRKRSGAAEYVARWSYPLHRFDVRYGVRNYDDLRSVQAFFIARLGPATGFRFRDPLDFTTAADASYPSTYLEGSTPTFSDVVIAVGDGVTTVFQLVKKYSDLVITRVRNIYKPKAGTVLVAVNGVQKTEGADWTVDTTSGLITFAAAPALGEDVTAGYEFDVPVHFDESLDDGLFVELTSFGAGDLPSIPIVEVAQAGIVPDEYFYGGSEEFLTFSAPISITPGGGRVKILAPSTTGLSVTLPDTTEMPNGGPWFYLVNITSNSVLVKNRAGLTQFTLPGNDAAEVLLATVGGLRIWYGA